jgi:dipeptidase E
MRLLLISNSTNAGETYLQHPKTQIQSFLKDTKKVLFIPYAAVSFSFDEYERKVQSKFSEMGIEVESVHHSKFPKKAVQEAEAIVVGGGNTFRLLKMIHQFDLIEAVRYKVLSGTPYVGWSAGANVACQQFVQPTICQLLNLIILVLLTLSDFKLTRIILIHIQRDMLAKPVSKESSNFWKWILTYML